MRHSRGLALSVLCLTGFALVACGSGDDGVAAGNDAVPMAGTGFDESDLLPDFPTDLIPPHHDSGCYVELGPTPRRRSGAAAPCRTPSTTHQPTR